MPHFQPLWRPLIRSDFFTFFVNILAPFSYFCLLPIFPVSFIIFAAPWFLSYSLFDLKILNTLASFLVSFPFFIGSFSFNLFLLSLTGRHPCVFLFISYFLLISSRFSFSFAYFLSLPSSPSLAPLFFPFFLSLSLLLSFSPLLFGAPLRPPGVQAHAMHPPGYATDDIPLMQFASLNLEGAHP